MRGADTALAGTRGNAAVIIRKPRPKSSAGRHWGAEVAKGVAEKLVWPGLIRRLDPGYKD
jgi:hypothetical protein